MYAAASPTTFVPVWKMLGAAASADAFHTYGNVTLVREARAREVPPPRPCRFSSIPFATLQHPVLTLVLSLVPVPSPLAFSVCASHYEHPSSRPKRDYDMQDTAASSTRADQKILLRVGRRSVMHMVRPSRPFPSGPLSDCRLDRSGQPVSTADVPFLSKRFRCVLFQCRTE